MGRAASKIRHEGGEMSDEDHAVNAELAQLAERLSDVFLEYETARREGVPREVLIQLIENIADVCAATRARVKGLGH